MMNRRAQIAETITWIVAFLIIFFIMLLFIGSAAILAQGKSVLKTLGFGGNKIYTEAIEISNKSTEENAMALLGRSIEYKGSIVRVNDILALGATEENLKIIGSAIGESCKGVVLNASSLYLVKEKGKTAVVSKSAPDARLFSSAKIIAGRDVEINYLERGCE